MAAGGVVAAAEQRDHFTGLVVRAGLGDQRLGVGVGGEFGAVASSKGDSAGLGVLIRDAVSRRPGGLEQGRGRGEVLLPAVEAVLFDPFRPVAHHQLARPSPGSGCGRACFWTFRGMTTLLGRSRCL